jgi:hypothetical protein
MREAKKTLKDLLLGWRACGLSVERAIQERDFNACRKADSLGKRLFAELADLLDEPEGVAELIACKDDLQAGAALWRSNIEAMPDWLAETGKELDSVRSRMTKRNKLSGAYELFKRSSGPGARLKIKAR